MREAGTIRDVKDVGQIAQTEAARVSGPRIGLASLGLRVFGSMKVAAYFRANKANPFPDGGRSRPIHPKFVSDSPLLAMSPLTGEILAHPTDVRLAAITRPLRELLEGKGYNAEFAIRDDGHNCGKWLDVILSPKRT
jgi:hypothetical protein